MASTVKELEKFMDRLAAARGALVAAVYQAGQEDAELAALEADIVQLREQRDALQRELDDVRRRSASITPATSFPAKSDQQPAPAAAPTRKKSQAAKPAKAAVPQTRRRQGRPSTKPEPSPLTRIEGIGATIARRFEGAGVKTIRAFAELSDADMMEIFHQCGPRYASVDGARVQAFRERARVVQDAAA